MNNPNIAPNPNPIVPEITVFAGHDSIAACICSFKNTHISDSSSLHAVCIYQSLDSSINKRT